MIEIEEFINKQVLMIKSGFGLEQIQHDCFNYILENYAGILRIDSCIYKSMELYAEIIKRSEINNK